MGLLNQRGERGIHKTSETRDEGRRLESTCRSPGNEPRVPGKEAEMKGRSSWGKTGRENRTRLFSGTGRAATPALCINAIKAQWAGAHGLESLSSSRSQGQPECGAGATGGLAQRGQRPGQPGVKPSFQETGTSLLPRHCPGSSLKPSRSPDPS